MTSPNVSKQELLAFAAGELTGERAERVEAVLRTDRDARQTVALYRLARERLAEGETEMPPAELVARAKAIFQPQPTARPGWLDVVDAIIGRLVYDSRVQPAAVRFTGTSERVQLTYEAEGVDVDLQAERLERDAPGTGERWRLTGQIDVEAEAPIEAALLATGGDAVVEELALDDRGMFSNDIEPGRYELRLRVGERMVILPDINLE
jgi:anti-sigma factor RsiW